MHPSVTDASPAVRQTCALTRCVRFEVSPSALPVENPNTWSASPVCAGVGAYFEVEFRVDGPLDSKTGMVADIRTLDALGRDRFAPLAAESLVAGGPSAGEVMRTFVEQLTEDDPPLTSVVWHLNPRLRITMRLPAMHEILITHRYQFAASHRLFIADLSEEENLAIFGKCCWLNGHGHNYHVEVEVAAPVDGRFSRQQLDALVQQEIIERFDHKYLNLDCPEFADRTPTVENITIVCHDLLQEPVAQAGGRLYQVRVWETEKTWSAYPLVAAAPECAS